MEVIRLYAGRLHQAFAHPSRPYLRVARGLTLGVRQAHKSQASEARRESRTTSRHGLRTPTRHASARSRPLEPRREIRFWLILSVLSALVGGGALLDLHEMRALLTWAVGCMVGLLASVRLVTRGANQPAVRIAPLGASTALWVAGLVIPYSLADRRVLTELWPFAAAPAILAGLTAAAVRVAFAGSVRASEQVAPPV